MAVKEDNPPPSNLQLGAKHYVGRGAFIDDAGFSSFRRFHETISEAVRKTAVTETCEAPIDLDPALERLRTEFRVASAGSRPIGASQVSVTAVLRTASEMVS